MDKLTSSNIADLDPVFRPVVEAWITRCNAALMPSKSHMHLTVTWRSPADQEADKAAGLSKAGAGRSPHNCCTADGTPAARGVDFAVYNADGSYVKDGSDPRYTQCGWIACDMGMTWGGTWSMQRDNCKPDYDHVQMKDWRFA